jgi:rubrerythrin
MTKFRCKRCNYQFQREAGDFPKSCPNCGETNSIRKEQSAEELLNDSDLD